MCTPDAAGMVAAAPSRLRVLVLGGGDVGSAVAHRLFRGGCEVLLCELEGSAHARRGMAFTDALFDGSACLDGVEARRHTDVAGVIECWSRAHHVPIVTLPEADLLAQLRFGVVVDATMRRQRAPVDLRTVAPLSIGLGPGHIPGQNCHVAIETQWGEAMGRVLRDAPAAARSGGPRALDGVTRERFVPAARAGAWRTQARLGQSVVAGEVIGWLDGEATCAPISGTLRGLARDGVQVRYGQRVIEVDPRAAPQVHGLGERPRAIARGVAAALGME
jgi:xanthine dehydrogenase accessory factor